MNFQQALRDLDARQPESMPEPSLDRIRAIAELLDQPERTYPSVQVTGTNGKTTIARLVSALACAHGLTTGTFTSPHLTSVTERLSVCGTEVTVAEFGEEYERLLPYLQSVDVSVGPVTYFEALTALAYLWFADKPVGLGVFEVGMGGTWDATNLVRGEISVVGPIGLDHVDQLGHSVEEIAREKSGVIKEGATTVVREQRPEAMRVLEQRAAQVGATLVVEGRDFSLADRAQAVGGQLVTVAGIHAGYEEFFLPLFGEAVARNAAAAVAAVEALLGRALDVGAVAAALGAASVPGRVEVAGHQPLVVLDGAHNPDAARSLVETLREAFRWSRLHLVIAMFGDKDVAAVTGDLAAITDRAYVAPNSAVRSATADRVAEGLRSGAVADVQTFTTVEGALQAAIEAAEEEDLILVTGSFYTVGDARRALASVSHPPADPASGGRS
ncbi:MAG TPA: Mur ligase family protein [Actinomycetota bacterium]|nr:Mur ligase family protein [Actinomycetota bacterium]